MEQKSDTPRLINAQDVIDAVTAYNANADTDLIRRACEFCIEHHGTQMRASGDPYYTHPFAVACHLAELKPDTATVITGLLHDTVEDTPVTAEDIAREFGDEVAALVNGVTKLAQIKFRSAKHKQAENFRKLLIAISEDIRVLIVKLADRLHNMSTLQYMKSPEKRRRIAHETMEIYAPLAERVGIQHYRNALQELAFKELYPEVRDSIVSRLEYLRAKGGEAIRNAENDIRLTLQQSEVKGIIGVYGREKSPCSIWRKMERKRVSFEQLADIIAYRVIVKDEEACYAALGAVHRAYKVVPGRFKDYISLPKDNGYRSLHTVLIGPGKQTMEVQIRTAEMHDVAEYGVAAHWAYKDYADTRNPGINYRWVRDLLQIHEQTGDPEEFLENTKMEMGYDQVFCFSPKGDLIALPKNSTGIDFAYAVHSNLGNHCAGVKLNGHIVPLRTVLENGDQVEILTSETQLPSANWLQFVATGRAKSEIRRILRAQQRQEYVKVGRSLAEQEAQRIGIEDVHAAAEAAVARTRRKSVDELFMAIGQGNVPVSEALKDMAPEGAQLRRKSAGGMSLLNRFSQDKRKKSDAIPVKGLIPGMAVNFADCCTPIPGDTIAGVIITGKGLIIHTSDCEALAGFMSSPERLVDVSWDSSKAETVYTGRLKVTLSHKAGTLAHLAEIVAKHDGNINNLKITERAADFFELVIDIQIKGAKQLSAIISSLRSSPRIQAVQRYKGR